MTQAAKKREHLVFLAQDTDRTLAQAAIKFSLAQPSIATVLPNITNEENLKEYTATSETPDLTSEELARIAELFDNDFYLDDVLPENFRSSRSETTA